MTNAKLLLIKFEKNDIINNIIISLNEDKVRGHDNISIRTLKICDTGIVETLSIIFNNCINQSMVPDNWKKLNISPFHKNDDKQTINNYRPVPLLPIASYCQLFITYTKLLMPALLWKSVVCF